MTRDWIWSSDGSEIWYFNRPDTETSGTWAENIHTRRRRWVSPYWGQFSPSRNCIVRTNSDRRKTAIIDLVGRRRLTINSSIDQLSFHPSEQLFAVTRRRPGTEHPSMRPCDIEIMHRDGSTGPHIATLLGKVAGWVSDDLVALVGRQNLSGPTILRVVDTAGNPWREWELCPHLRDFQLSPSGRFASYTSVFASSGENGQFILDVDSGRRTAVQTPSNVRWLPDESGLIYLTTQRNAAGGFDFWFAPLPWSKPTLCLTERMDDPVRMESFDWKISPRGNALAYRTERTLRLHTIVWSE